MTPNPAALPDLSNYKPKRPLLHRLVDLEHTLKLDDQPIFALDVREAIEKIEGLEKAVDPPKAGE